MNLFETIFFSIGVLSVILLIDHIFFKPGRDRRLKEIERLFREERREAQEAQEAQEARETQEYIDIGDGIDHDSPIAIAARKRCFDKILEETQKQQTESNIENKD